MLCTRVPGEKTRTHSDDHQQDLGQEVRDREEDVEACRLLDADDIDEREDRDDPRSRK